MGILATKEPGILISAVFDSKAKTLKAELAAFEKKLVELQAAQALGGFIAATKREGSKLTVKVLAASSSSPSGEGARADKPSARPARGGGWSPTGKSAQQVAAAVKKDVGGWGKK